MSNDTRRQIVGFLDVVAGIGLKLGAVATGLALAYLLYVIFGPKLTALKTMKGDDRETLLQSIGWARTMLRYGSIALVFGLCVRLINQETIGLILTLVGAGVYFFSPGGFSSLTLNAHQRSELYQGMVNDISIVGLICLVPGIVLLVRDLIMRVVRRFSAAQQPAAAESEIEITRKVHKPGIYEMCWNMACCNERAKRYCAAWKRRRPCWQLKSGCLCDPEVIQKALMDRDREMGVNPDSGTKAADKRPKVILSGQQKKERCRSCTIWIEHQRQKFRIATPVAIGIVAVGYGLIYKQLSGIVYNAFKNMDRFMSFLSYRQGEPDASFSQGHTVTTLAMICLGVVVLSFTFRAVEYLIFELEI